jgi:hypothetical protein
MVVARAIDESEITDSCVCGAGGIVKQRAIAKSIVAESGGVTLEGKGTYSIVEASFIIVRATGIKL